MKGVKFVTNDKNERVAVQIDLKSLEEHREEIEDLLDVIIAENRKDDEEVSWKSGNEITLIYIRRLLTVKMFRSCA